MKIAKILTLLILSIFLFGACAKKTEISLYDKIREKDEIVIGVKDDSKPFGYLKNGELVGFDIDIAKLIAKEILDCENPKIIYKPLKPNEKIYAINSGEVDMVIAIMSITPSRLNVIDFSQPYNGAGLAILTHKKSKINSMGDLNNKNVGVVLGTTGETTTRMLAPNAKLIGVKAYPDGFELLKQGKIEAFLADDTLLYGFVMDNKNYRIVPKRYSQEYYGIGIKKGDKKLLSVLNVIIKHMQESGELSQIRKKWIYH